MRSRTLLLTSVAVAAVFLIPTFAFAQGVTFPFFGPIVSPAISKCAAGWPGLIDMINRLIIFAITIVVVFVAPLIIAYAGFLYVVNPVNPAGKAKANGLMLDLVIGVVVALSAWLIVDAVMAVLYTYNPDDPKGFDTRWYEIITGTGDPCLKQEGSLYNLKQATLPTTITPGAVVGGGGPAVAAGSLCPDSSAACSPAALMAAGFPQPAANVMSCIATTENGGRATGCNGNACGTFQIMLTANPLVGPNCAQYNGGSSPIYCPSLCKAANGGAVKNESSCQRCVQAANDPQCNAQSAYNLYKTSGYKPWTSFSDNTKSGGCIAKYGTI